jgi:hypothetical protein
VKTHLFESSAEAYDASQTDGAIRDGDVLVVASEGIVGVLIEAWPTAVVYDGDTGAFHRFADGVLGDERRKRYKRSIAEARSVAQADADITGNAHWATA